MVPAHDHQGCNAPSAKERIVALHKHNHLFETMAENPQTGIFERFEKQWAFVASYTESQVHRYWNDVEMFLEQHGQTGGKDTEDEALQNGLDQSMSPLMDFMFKDCTYFSD